MLILQLQEPIINFLDSNYFSLVASHYVQNAKLLIFSRQSLHVLEHLVEETNLNKHHNKKIYYKKVFFLF